MASFDRPAGEQFTGAAVRPLWPRLRALYDDTNAALKARAESLAREFGNVPVSRRRP
jgi:hypothetical protein